MWQSLGPVLGWDRFWKKWFSEFLKRNEVGTSQIGVERQKEPDVTALPAQRLEGAGGGGRGQEEKKELQIGTCLCNHHSAVGYSVI